MAHLSCLRQLLSYTGAEHAVFAAVIGRFPFEVIISLLCAVLVTALVTWLVLFVLHSLRYWRFSASKVRVLHEAVVAGDQARVLSLVHAGMAVNRRDPHGRTALHHAARCGHAAIARVLLEHGASIRAADRWKNTALHLAAAGGHLDSVQILLDTGAALNERTCHGKLDGTPLVYAAQNGHERTADLLLARGAQVTSDAVSAAAKSRSAPLVWDLTSRMPNWPDSCPPTVRQLVKEAIESARPGTCDGCRKSGPGISRDFVIYRLTLEWRGKSTLVKLCTAHEARSFFVCSDCIRRATVKLLEAEVHGTKRRKNWSAQFSRLLRSFNEYMGENPLSRPMLSTEGAATAKAEEELASELAKAWFDGVARSLEANGSSSEGFHFMAADAYLEMIANKNR